VRSPQSGQIRLLPVESPDDWEYACGAFPMATAFHRYDFLQSVAPSLSCEFVPLRVVSAGRPVGVAPLMVKRIGPFCTINWVPFPYLGPLVPEPLLPATLSALRLEARRRRAVAHQQSFSQRTDHGQAEGFDSSTDRTLVIPLSGRSDNDLLSAMQKKRREETRRAQRAGFEVCPARIQDFEDVDPWIDHVYAAQGMRNTYSAGTCAQVFRALADAPGCAFLVARLNNRAVGVIVALATAQRAFGWLVAIDPRYRSYHPQALLTWHALLWARDAGAAEFDLVGTPNEGIATYKRRFGAHERSYTVLLRQASPHRAALSALTHGRAVMSAGSPSIGNRHWRKQVRPGTDAYVRGDLQTSTNVPRARPDDDDIRVISD
jgi:CelD/BcsL family acetyltransferase involved in cellulose biosynthesis